MSLVLSAAVNVMRFVKSQSGPQPSAIITRSCCVAAALIAWSFSLLDRYLPAQRHASSRVYVLRQSPFVLVPVDLRSSRTTSLSCGAAPSVSYQPLHTCASGRIAEHREMVPLVWSRGRYIEICCLVTVDV